MPIGVVALLLIIVNMILQSSNNRIITVHNLLSANNGGQAVPLNVLLELFLCRLFITGGCILFYVKNSVKIACDYVVLWKSKIMDCDTVTNIFMWKGFISILFSPQSCCGAFKLALCWDHTSIQY